MITDDQKEMAYVQAKYAAREATRSKDDDGLCAYFALFGMIELKELGLKPCIQGGSAFWPRVPEPENTPESVATHYGYQWEPGSEMSKMAVKMGCLPEMHIWIGLVETQELVDFSTTSWPTSASNRGVEWFGDRPPGYVWCQPEGLPKYVRYEADPIATRVAARYLSKLLGILAKEK